MECQNGKNRIRPTCIIRIYLKCHKMLDVEKNFRSHDSQMKIIQNRQCSLPIKFRHQNFFHFLLKFFLTALGLNYRYTLHVANKRVIPQGMIFRKTASMALHHGNPVFIQNIDKCDTNRSMTLGYCLV